MKKDAPKHKLVVQSPENFSPGLWRLIAVGLVLLVLAGGLSVVFRFVGARPPLLTPTPVAVLPSVDVKAPLALAELTAQYPNLNEVLNDPELATVYKEFLVAYETGGESAALELAVSRDLLTPDALSLRVTLVLDTEDYGILLEELDAVGVTVVSSYRDRVNIAVPISLIKTQLQSADPQAIFSRLTQLDHVIAVRLPESTSPQSGGIDGEGVAYINAAAWHAAGWTGEGVRVGVLDLGFAGYEALLGSDLPSDITMETFGWYDEDEMHGSACAEIIHEVAPDADLVFAWYDGSEAAMGEAVDWLLAQGVDIISHSAGALVGPRDGSGWKAQLVDYVSAQEVCWVNASGNEAQKHYRGVFTDADGDGIHEFAPGEELLALDPQDEVLIFLQWADDWGRPQRNYEFYLVDENAEVLAFSEDLQSGELGQLPVEGISYAAGGQVVYVMISRNGDSDDGVILDIYAGAGVEMGHLTAGYSLSTPADAIGALTVGAVNWWDDFLSVYSSQGPSADGRLKPEISAPAGVTSHAYNGHLFEGTSAAAPHVSGAAALVWQVYPDFSRRQVVDYLLAQTVDLGPQGPDTGYGYGRVLLPDPAQLDAAMPDFSSDILDLTPTPSGSGVFEPLVPLPTPTSVVFVTPEPVSGATVDVNFTQRMTLFGLLVTGMGCSGVVLLLFSVFLLLTNIRRRRLRAVPVDFIASPAILASGEVPRPSAGQVLPPEEILSPRIVSVGAVNAATLCCPVCSAPSRRADAKYCSVCGSLLTATEHVCRYCGAELRSSARFCAQCGNTVEPAAPATPPDSSTPKVS